MSLSGMGAGNQNQEADKECSCQILLNKRGLVRKNERRNGERTKPGDGKEGKLVRVSQKGKMVCKMGGEGEGDAEALLENYKEQNNSRSVRK
jgi:hypothetical protein